MQYYAIDEICFKDSIPYSLILLSGTDKFLHRANARYSIFLHFLVCYRSDDIQCLNANFFKKLIVKINKSGFKGAWLEFWSF